MAKGTVYLNKSHELGFMLAEGVIPDSCQSYFLINKCFARAKYRKGESEALKILLERTSKKGKIRGVIEYYTNSMTIAKGLTNQKFSARNS